MNQRIHNLAKQAGIFTNQNVGLLISDPDKWVNHFSEKFAELIVQECVGVADHSNVTGKSIVGERIKQHFGVEE